MGESSIYNGGASPRMSSGKIGREALERLSNRDEAEADGMPSTQSQEGRVMEDNAPIHGLSNITPSASGETDPESGYTVSSLCRSKETPSPQDSSFTAEHQHRNTSLVPGLAHTTLCDTSTEESSVSTGTALQTTGKIGHADRPLDSTELRVQESKTSGIQITQITQSSEDQDKYKGDIHHGQGPSESKLVNAVSTDAIIAPELDGSQAADKGRGREHNLTIEVPDPYDHDIHQSDPDPKKKEFEEILSELARRKSSTPKKTVTVDGVEYSVKVGSAMNALRMVDYLFSPPYDREVFCCAYVHNAMKTALKRVSTAGKLLHSCTLLVILLAT